MLTILNLKNWAFAHIENKRTLYCRKDCMKMFCESLREHVKNINDFGEKKLSLLTKEEIKSHQDTKVYYICGKRILKKLSKSINYLKVRDHCYYTGKYRGAAHHSICNLKSNVPNEIPVVFHNSSNCDHYFIIKKLANEFEEKIRVSWEKYRKVRNFFQSNRKRSYKNQ